MGRQVLKYLPFSLAEGLEHRSVPTRTGSRSDRLGSADQPGEVRIRRRCSNPAKQGEHLGRVFEEWTNVLFGFRGVYGPPGPFSGLRHASVLLLSAGEQYQSPDILGQAWRFPDLQLSYGPIGATAAEVDPGQGFPVQVFRRAVSYDAQCSFQVTELETAVDFDLIENSYDRQWQTA